MLTTSEYFPSVTNDVTGIPVLSVTLSGTLQPMVNYTGHTAILFYKDI